MDMHDEAFTYLSHFLGGYMNQDWDISGHGNTLEEVVAYYAKVSDPDEAHGLKMDIKRFIAAKGNDIDREFERLFQPEIIPSAWDMSTRDWLLWIERLVGDELRKRPPERA